MVVRGAWRPCGLYEAVKDVSEGSARLWLPSRGHFTEATAVASNKHARENTGCRAAVRCSQGTATSSRTPAAPPVISTPKLIVISRSVRIPSPSRVLLGLREAQVELSEGRRARHTVAALYRLLVAHLTPGVGAQEKRHTSSGVSRAFLAFVAQNSGTPTPRRACAARGHNMADPPPPGRGPD